MDLIKKCYALLDRRRRLQLVGVFLITVVIGFVSTAGVASIMPFMAVVADPDVVVENRWLAWAYTSFGFETTNRFVTALGLLTLVIIAGSHALSALHTWVVARFQQGLNHELCCRLFEKYLDQSYSFYLDRNSSKLTTNILSEVSTVISGVIAPLLEMFARVVIGAFIFALLCWVDAVLASLVVLVIGSLYGGVYLAVRQRQAALGRERVAANALRFRAVREAFGGIKDVKVLQREASFLDHFRAPSRRFAKTNVSNAVVSQVPRYALETVAFGGILLIVLYLLRTYQDLGQVLPIISLYAFAAYRLMPAFQVVFNSLAKLRFNAASVDDVYADMTDDALAESREDVIGLARDRRRTDGARLEFHDEIVLENVGFTYPGAHRPALRDVSLVIPKDTTVGLVGHTGSGKTTLVDLLLGLFEPTEGRLLVDGEPIRGGGVFRWRRRIGYVPQQIYLTDDTFRRNIAFGIPEGDVDEDRVRRAARIAHLHEFVESLPRGYETVVGDRGVRLSGGQRQRVGIARAVYDNPDVLVMDEATSSLDNLTESAVMDAIRELSGKKTVVLIAHRLTTVEGCDRIFLLEDGRLIGSGTYAELLDRSASFRALTQAAS